MKVLGILLVIFVSKTNSKLFDTKILTQPISQILCGAGKLTGSVSTQTKAACSDLSGSNNPLVKTADVACTATTEVVDGVSNVLTKNCIDRSQDPSLPTQDPSYPQKDDTATTTLSPSTAPPRTQRKSTKSPTTPTTKAAPSTTQSTSTQPPTTPTTQPPMTTTPKPCTQNRIRQCKERCERDAQVDLNLGGVCSRYAGNNQRCDCIPVRHCETYTNATCTMKCNNKEICRIPEANLPCVCKTPNGKYTTYRTPDSPFE